MYNVYRPYDHYAIEMGSPLVSPEHSRVSSYGMGTASVWGRQTLQCFGSAKWKKL